jgi:nucleotide-binding universal stress UspA family protein
VKKILAVLDGSKKNEAVQKYAIQLAKSLNCSLLGLAVLDVPWITASQPEPLGGSSFKLQRDEILIHNTEEHIKTLFQNFKNACEKENVAYEARETQGFPSLEIEDCLHECDALIIGNTTDFHFDLDKDTDWAVKHVIRSSARPTFVIPELSSTPQKILAAYDGHQQSSKALHLFFLLGLAEGKEITILTIQTDKAAAEKIAQKALKLCQLYNVKASIQTVITDDAPENVILDTAKNEGSNLIVMGAFSNNMLKEAIFGSCTKYLMKKSLIPLFVFH